jgi:hypothetical protein
MYFGIVNTGYATSFFTPTILRQLGWTSVRAQVINIPNGGDDTSQQREGESMAQSVANEGCR